MRIHTHTHTLVETTQPMFPLARSLLRLYACNAGALPSCPSKTSENRVVFFFFSFLSASRPEISEFKNVSHNNSRERVHFSFIYLLFFNARRNLHDSCYITVSLTRFFFLIFFSSVRQYFCKVPIDIYTYSNSKGGYSRSLVCKCTPFFFPLCFIWSRTGVRSKSKQ